MVENESQIPEVPQENTWIYLRDIPPVDFWFGSQYRGNFYNRLQLNLKAVENICRAGDMPPIILCSDKWDPPAIFSPDVVAPGLSAFKKVSFQKNPELPESDKDYYRLIASDTFRSDGSMSKVPMGWVIHIKDRKLLHDYEYNHPQTSREEKEKYFAREFNTILKKALIHIAIKETVAERLLDKNSRAKIIALRAIAQTMALYGNFDSHKTIESLLLTYFKKTVGIQSIAKMISILFTDRYPGVNYIPKNVLGGAAHSWRFDNFPERSKLEYKDSNILQELATTAIPGNFFFGNLYATYAALQKNKKPLVQLAGIPDKFRKNEDSNPVIPTTE